MTQSAPPSLAETAPRKSPFAIFWRAWDAAGMLVIYALLLVVCFFTIPDFFGKNHMLGLAQIITSVGIVACGMLFCLASGDFRSFCWLGGGALGGVVAVLVVNATGSITLAILAWTCGGGAGRFYQRVHHRRR